MLVDGAQAAAHLPIDVQALGCDFYALSGHKCYGPTGIGLLYGRAELLSEDAAVPRAAATWSARVTFERTTYAPVPHRFEAGTPNLEGAVGLAAAFDYLGGRSTAPPSPRTSRICWPTPPPRLEAVPGLRLVGRARDKSPIVSFVMEGVHAHDVGHHRRPARRRHPHRPPLRAAAAASGFGLAATARASMALYNTREDIDALVRRRWLEVAGAVPLMTGRRRRAPSTRR